MRWFYFFLFLTFTNLFSGEKEPITKEAGKPIVKPATSFYIMQNLTTAQGLALNSTNTAGLVDKQGNLWFGTFNAGVSRYDGVSFVSYTSLDGLVDNYVQTILQDQSGNLWFGTEGGLTRYDGRSFTAYTTAEGLPNKSVLSLFEDKKKNLWIGTKDGVSRYDGKSFTPLTGLPNNYVMSIIEDRAGHFWFGTLNGAIRYDGKTFHSYTKAEGLIGNTVQALSEDSQGNLWFGTTDGLSRYDGKAFTSFTTNEGLVGNKVWEILEDSKGHLWIGTLKGASCYDGKSFTNFTKENGLPENDVRTIVEDASGNIWFGTNGMGIAQYNGKAFINYTMLQGLSNNYVMSIVEDRKKNLWLGTEGGINQYNGKTFASYTTAQGLPDNYVKSSLQDKEGHLWFGTKNGVTGFDGQSFTLYTTEQGLPDNYVRYILEDKRGNLWFATDKGGVSKYDKHSFTNYGIREGLVDNTVWTILEDKKGDLWFGTSDGISRYDGESFVNYTMKEGLPSNFTMSSLEDREGNLWFGTSGGISRYDGESFKTFSTRQGLPDNVIYQIMIADKQNILFGTNLGIAILTGYRNEKGVHIPPQTPLKNSELNNYIPIFESYNAKRGYPISDANGGQNAIFQDSEGTIWIGTGSSKTGLVRFDYDAINKNKNPLNLFITSIKIDNEPIAWSDLLKIKEPIEETTLYGHLLSKEDQESLRKKFGNIKFDSLSKFYFIPKNLELPFIHNNITFDFVAIEPAFPQNVLYQYKLEGYDKDWSPPSNTTKANYGNIFEGTYQFKVKAKSPYDVWSEPIIYTFKVIPPWYRTWWAYSLYAMSTFIAFYLFFQSRTRILRKRLEHIQRLYDATERFVPKRFLELLQKQHLEDVELGDSIKLPVSAMFAFIRGFDTLAESLTPEKMALLLNTYMQHMVPVIQQNKGFVNLFLGDGILALFPEHPADSVEAALAMLEQLPSFDKDIVEKGFQPISVSIGLNTGDAMLLAMGVKERLEASVVSDTINTASRIESLNKLYKTQLLISQTLYSQLPQPEKYLIRLVDKVVLKGKVSKTHIYEVQPLPDKEILERERLYNSLYEEGFSYYEKGDLIQAQNLFNSCLDKKPDDPIVKLLLERCILFLNTGVPADWDGTITLEEK